MADTFSYYVIGVLDILGQRRQLLQPIKFPAGTTEWYRETSDVAKRTAEVVRAFRQDLKGLFDDWCMQLDNEREEQSCSAQTNDYQPKIKYWGMSDTYVFATLIEPEKEVAAMRGILLSLGAASMAWMSQMSRSHPIRGGIELGLATALLDNKGEGDYDLYGPALVKAHLLESQFAEGPRIAVGPFLVNLLQDMRARLDEDNMDIRRAANLAKTCLSFLKRDQDGTVIVDVIGRQMASRGPDQFWPMFDLVQDNVRNELSRHAANNDGKLVARYKKLNDYFEEQATHRPGG